MKCSEPLQTLRVKLTVLLLLLLPVASLGAEVVLKGSSRVSGGKVVLGDIADVEGTAVEREILKGIPVATSPPPCREKTLSKEAVARAIADYLRDNGISVREIAVKGPERVRVISTCFTVDGEHLKELVVKFFERNYPQYEVISVPRVSLKLPYRDFKEHLYLDYLGNRSARLVYEVSVGGRTVRKLWLPVRVERKVKVVVAVKPIPEGSVISLDDVALKEVRESRARGGTDNLSSVVGATAKKSYLPGEVITENGIEPKFAVRRNQPVRVVYKRGAIRVELLGISLQDGVVGNIIKVKNPSTGKVLLCRVTGNGLVEFVSR